MRAISKEELKDILDKHGKWLRSEEGGERADLSYVDLSHADLSYVDLSHAELSYADLCSADLNHADLSHVDLISANLRYANLSYADLSYADLRAAILSSANLRHVNFNYANLNYADLSHADLSHADLSYAEKKPRKSLKAHAPKEGDEAWRFAMDYCKSHNVSPNSHWYEAARTAYLDARQSAQAPSDEVMVTSEEWEDLKRCILEDDAPIILMRMIEARQKGQRG